ncbi:hypothetical protein EVAR_37581_1 [Eumeta japonica]|uniref:Uncharacterized protein n=1 Tax=Eumeta variegata TaxID=151549 RepID=A0A4C1VNS1_EUMVA|nr:hypothetical protein EVAR_37581_1 [Eumeta japonica]
MQRSKVTGIRPEDQDRWRGPPAVDRRRSCCRRAGAYGMSDVTASPYHDCARHNTLCCTYRRAQKGHCAGADEAAAGGQYFYFRRFLEAAGSEAFPGCKKLF